MLAGEKQNGSESTTQRLGHSSGKHLAKFSLQQAKNEVDQGLPFIHLALELKHIRWYPLWYLAITMK